jgi:hypothetical protein
MFTNLISVSESRIESLSPVYHEQSVLSVSHLILLEDLVVVDVRHLPSKLSDCELAVAVQVLQGRLILPVVSVLL